MYKVSGEHLLAISGVVVLIKSSNHILAWYRLVIILDATSCYINGPDEARLEISTSNYFNLLKSYHSQSLMLSSFGLFHSYSPITAIFWTYQSPRLITHWLLFRMLHCSRYFIFDMNFKLCTPQNTAVLNSHLAASSFNHGLS